MTGNVEVKVSEILPCPFCGGKAHLSTVARDWYRITADHAESCLLEEQQFDCPQSDDQLPLLVRDWNARQVPTWQPMGTCPKHVDVLFFQERNGVIPGRLTDADSFMTDKERDEWDGGEEAQFRIDAFGFGHWGVDRMEGCEAPMHWMPYPEGPEAAQ